MGLDRAEKPHRRKRDDADAHNIHPTKHFAYSEAKHKDAAALRSQYRAEIKAIYDAYTALSDESTGAEEAAKAFKTIINACQGASLHMLNLTPALANTAVRHLLS